MSNECQAKDREGTNAPKSKCKGTYHSSRNAHGEDMDRETQMRAREEVRSISLPVGAHTQERVIARLVTPTCAGKTEFGWCQVM